MSREHSRPLPGRPAARKLVGSLLLVSLASTGCGAESQSADPPLALFDRLQKVDRDLGLGSEGEDVRAVQEYLVQFGYFPNASLERQYPRWRPIVPVGPSRSGLYDGSTVLAVRAFQRHAGVTDTGVVDQVTREILGEHRCGMPEGIRELDSRDKFALEGSTWPITHLTWRYLSASAPTNIDALGARTAITAAFATWNGRTNLTFEERAATDTTAKITVAWSTATNGALAVAFFPSAGQGTIKVNQTFAWTLNGAVSGRRDYQTTLLHEIGHTLGLNHSSVGGTATVMRGSQSTNFSRRQLGNDDILAISTRYNPWQIVPGCVKDLAVGNDQSVWVIGCDNVAQKRNNNGSWSATSPAQTGYAISVDNSGRPWVIALNGQVVARSTNSAATGSWQAVPNTCAKDIAASSVVWITGCDIGPNGWVMRYNGSSFVQESAQFFGTRIAVEQGGKPWLVRNDGTVWRRNSSSATSGTWERVRDGWFFGPDADIGVALSDASVHAWVTDTIASPPDIWAWNKQPGTGGDIFDPEKNDWVKVAGHSNRVSVGPGNPWVAATSTGGISPMLKRPAHP